MYGPNQDNPEFFNDLVFKKIIDWNPDFSIFAGDFNVVLNPSIDTKNYQRINNPNAMQALKNQIQQFNLIDIWRELHPDKRTFTWQKYNENKQSRLDFFLISASLLPFVQSAGIFPSFCSDHSSIELEIDFSKFVRGKGFWKFNNSLLSDPQYLELIKSTIKRVTAQYAIIDGDENFYTNATEEEINSFYSTNPEALQFINLKINHQSFLDILLMEIRRVTITFSARKKRERQFNEQKLIALIESLETQLAAEYNEENFQNINEDLQTKKVELDNIYAFQAQGAFIRARARYKTEGEKPSRLFCSLEKHNAVQKHIPKLNVVKDNTNKELTEQKSIENEIFNYYRDLFALKPTEDSDIESFLTAETSASSPKLSESQKNQMERIMTTEELTKHLKKTKNNVSPGTSGFTNEFFKFFWIDMKLFVTKAINFGYESGMLSVTQRLGIITLIPKGDKDKTYLKNWRPLTLLNSLYKLVSGCIADRIKPCLDTIINGDQKGFVSGRYIGEVIRSTYDILQWAKNNNKTGVLLLIDFEKAYDSLSFSFIKKCLKFYNFGECIIKWVDILLHNFSAVINHCGNVSRKFNIGRGARQGDPIASYIFIICIEILAHKLREDPSIQGFQVNTLTHMLELYADDCSIFLEAKDENLRNTLKNLDNFFKISGLKISISKTKAVWFGAGHNNQYKLCPDLTLDWDKQFRLLGVDFTNNLEGMEVNFRNKVEEIRKLFNCWIHRTLTVYGKIVVIKTLALSKLSHLPLVLPDINANQLKELEKLIFQFLWNNKPDKVSREHSKLKEKAGGLGVTDIKSFWQALKFSWFRRALNTSAFWPNILIDEIKDVVGHDVTISEIMQFGPNYLSFIAKKIKNDFWKQVFLSVNPIMQGAIFCHPENLFIAPLWDNPQILRNNKPIKKSAFINLAERVNTMSDFYKQGSNLLLDRDDLSRKFDIILGEDAYIELRYIFKIAQQNLGINDTSLKSTFRPFQPLLIAIANQAKKGCNVYYKYLRKKINLNTTLSQREAKWHDELNCTLSKDFWNKTYNLTSSIKNDNKMKYLQYQINRNSLYTNYRVSKFKPNVSPSCIFCLSNNVPNPPPELISHIFFDCSYTNNLWREIRNWLRELDIEITLEKKYIIFGNQEEAFSSYFNYIVLCAKYFVWKSKFKSQELYLRGFQYFLRGKLEDLKNAYLLEGKDHMFEQWNILFDYLSSLE